MLKLFLEPQLTASVPSTPTVAKLEPDQAPSIGVLCDCFLPFPEYVYAHFLNL